MTMLHTYEQEGRHGIFRLTGQRDFAAAQQAWSLFFKTCADENLEGVLVLDQAESTLAPADVFFLVQWFGEQHFTSYTRIAVVHAANAHANQNAFGEVVAQNRGFQIRAFGHEAAARLWLSMAPPPPPSP